MPPTPCEPDAAAIVRRVTGSEPSSIARFTTGLSHHVYDVTTHGWRCVVRIGTSRSAGQLEAAGVWSALLRPLGVPLPEVFGSGVHNGFPFQVLERFPGTDLCNVYPALSSAQKRRIASGVVAAQACLAVLPAGNGYGFASRLDGPFPHPTWRGVLEAHLERSRRRLAATRLLDSAQFFKFDDAMNQLDSYLSHVTPQPFLDDTTTKNVICSDGQLSGIVDVDELCFGDALFTPALTKAALVASDHVTDYVDYWLEQVRPSEQQRAAFQLYTAMFCVDLVSEMGHRFNREEPEPVDVGRLRRLEQCLHEALASSPAA